MRNRDKEAKQVRKALDLMRKMNYWQRIIVRDWLNGWYNYGHEGEEE